MATYNLGRVGLNIRGDYDENTTYEKLDVVFYDGSSYVCIANSIVGETPTNENVGWQILAIGFPVDKDNARAVLGITHGSVLPESGSYEIGDIFFLYQ